jgi:hypothetical protein
MKRLLIIAIVVMAGAGSRAGLFTDINPAAFRGLEGSTFQGWMFSVPDVVSIPDMAVNPNGTAIARAAAGPLGNTAWESDYAGHQGVWVLDSGDTADMIIDIPNFPNHNPVKEMWVQVVYSSDGGAAPALYVLPNGVVQIPVPKMQLVNAVQLDPYYTHATFKLTIQPNPVFEQIVIRPRYAAVRIDEIIVETQCIPEPMTLGLFGVGALLSLRKRR